MLDAQHDSQANVTSIAMFADCPRRYYLSRYLGLETSGAGLAACARPLRPPPSADLFGMQVHALLAEAPTESPDPEASNWRTNFAAAR